VLLAVSNISLTSRHVQSFEESLKDLDKSATDAAAASQTAAANQEAQLRKKLEAQLVESVREAYENEMEEEVQKLERQCEQRIATIRKVEEEQRKQLQQKLEALEMKFDDQVGQRSSCRSPSPRCRSLLPISLDFCFDICVLLPSPLKSC
jgi:arginyl-tRNA synthetase